MPTRPSRGDGHALALTLLAAVVTVALLVVGGQSAGRATPPAPAPPATSWRGLLGSRPRVTVGQRMIVVLKAPSLAQRVAAAGGRVSDRQERAWSRQVLASQRLLISQLAVQGVSIRPEYRYTRVLNGFSAAVDPGAVSLLERDSAVAGVYPVRPAYPASISSQVLSGSDFGVGSGHRPGVGLAGVDGRGVTIALLDTGVDATSPYLRARILPGGIDIVGGSPGARPAANPDAPGQIERHGTEMAGLLVGAGGPSGLSGVAPGASILPIRVAGWQQDSTGKWALYGRSDQVIAGLDRAVDPNDDGDAHDAARIALIALAEPYAAFGDGPEARAVEGARELDTLVVAAVGNDGAAGPGFGSVAGPGGAADALTVGALDARTHAATVHVLVRSDLTALLDRRLPLAGAVSPRGTLDLRVAVPRGGAKGRGGTRLVDFFDRNGTSRVAGRAAFVLGGTSPVPAAEHAAQAGAAAILLYDSRTPPGGIGLDEDVSVPVVALPPATVRAIRERLGAGRSVTVSLGDVRLERNGDRGHVASFSSTGLAFDGTVKPDLVAPGVGLATSDPGTNPDGTPRFATVNGSSASAAVVAGAAALLAQARPSLSASQLASLLVGTGEPIGDASITEQGNGLVDVGAAAAAEIAASPVALSLGRSAGAGWQVRQRFALSNVSTRPVRVRVRLDQTRAGAAGVRFSIRPRTLLLRRGRTALVTVRATTSSPPSGTAPAEGAIVASVVGGSSIRVPWTISFGPPSDNLIDSLQLARHTFKPSDSSPTLLSFNAGEVLQVGDRQDVRPVARLDMELFNSAGDDLGSLARLRDLLPGRYGFGLTGRGPAGGVLPAGGYTLRLTAWPTDGGKPTQQIVRFTVAGGTLAGGLTPP